MKKVLVGNHTDKCGNSLEEFLPDSTCQWAVVALSGFS